MTLDREDPPNPVGYNILNLNWSNDSWWKISGWLVCNLGGLELTAITGRVGLLCNLVHWKVSKLVCKQASMQVSGHGSNQALAIYKGCPKENV